MFTLETLAAPKRKIEEEESLPVDKSLKIERLPAILSVVHVPPNHVEQQRQVQF